jgi:NodT family efflux transporter outer membrane factor (OMF) lipoprotein/RND family efflux transporter MFP subunit
MERKTANPGDGHRPATVPVAPLIGVLVSSLLIAIPGCGLDEWARNGGKVGPNYIEPPVAVADNWIDYRDPRIGSQAQQDMSHWWGVFDDPVLNSLVDEAYHQNLSLRAAGERIAAARGRYSIAAGNLFPQTQQLNGSYTANKASKQAVNGTGTEQWFHNAEVGFNVSWELDLWGRFRRAVEAADANVEASVADYDDVLVVLLADVAANYIQYRTFQERIVIARRNVDIQEKSYQLAQDKFKAGATTERDVQQARQILEQTRALIPQLEAGVRQAANALCVLLGIPPIDLTDRLSGAPVIPAAPAELALGIPADLLRRRPDVRRAERQAAAQSAFIGVAKSDLYPHFSILGSIGVRAEQFGDLFKTPGSLAGSIGPAFQWDILNYGRIEANVHVQEAVFRELVANYQQTVLQAGREAEDAAVGYLKAQERARYLNESVAAAARTVEITNTQYQQGAIDFTPLFLFQERLADQEDQLAVARNQIALNLVDLYRSLGGGWEMRLNDTGAAPTTRPATAPPPATTRPMAAASADGRRGAGAILGSAGPVGGGPQEYGAMRQTTLHRCGVGLFLGSLAAALGSLAGCNKAAPARAEPPPPKVTVARPEMRQVVDSDQYNGWLQSAQTVDVRSRVRGHLDKVNFADGDLVKKGQLLFELDPRPIQSDIDRSSDQVKVYEAQWKAASKEEKRLKELVTKGGASQSQVDAAEATAASLEAQIQAQKQEVVRKSLDLEYARVTAPIDGRIGRAMLTVGNLVNAGGSDPVLATIVSVDPVHVYFDVDERALQRYMNSRAAAATTRPSSVRESKMPFSFGLETEEGFPNTGAIDFANNQVDPQTGTIQVRGIVPNPDARFVPGSRVRVRVPVSEPHPVLLLPDTAVLSDQDKRYVLALDDKNIVQRRDVELGKLLDDGTRVIRPAAGAAAKGVTADDWVITEGIQAARLNYAVEPVRPAAPTTRATASSTPAGPAEATANANATAAR